MRWLSDEVSALQAKGVDPDMGHGTMKRRARSRSGFSAHMRGCRGTKKVAPGLSEEMPDDYTFP